jgi:hypothetical protein
VTRQVVLGVWALLAAGLVGCEVLAVVSRGRVAGARGALGLLVAAPWRMAACFVGWMWLGWHFFAR